MCRSTFHQYGKSFGKPEEWIKPGASGGNRALPAGVTKLGTAEKCRPEQGSRATPLGPGRTGKIIFAPESSYAFSETALRKSGPCGAVLKADCGGEA